jgi:hypothetical protein
MIRSRCLASIAVAAVGLVAAGCHPCLPMAQAEAARGRLEAQNRARAEPAMREAARLHGAVLLPTAPQDLPLPPFCGAPSYDWLQLHMHPDGACLEPSADPRVTRLRTPGRTPRLLIAVDSEAFPYARLARRDGKLFVLKPKITQRKAGDETECECDRMPRPVVPRAFAFVIDDMEVVEIETLEVPMTEDVVDWTCKVGLA